MRLPDFKLERYFARWEFDVRHTLCASDLEAWRLDELLALADRIVVMSEGRIVHDVAGHAADRHELGAFMGGKAHAPVQEAA